MRVLLGLISLVCFFSPLKCEGQKSGGLNEEIEDLAHRVSRLEVKILRISNTRSEFDAVSNTVKDIQGKYSRLEALEKHFNESNARIEGLIGKFPRDCQDLYDKNFKLMEVKSGHYLIYPNGFSSLDVYCEFIKENSIVAGWTQVMNRSIMNTDNEEFSKIPSYQKNGFGDVESADFWLGLEKIRYLTLQGEGSVSLRFEMTLVNNSNFFNEYENFRMDSEAHNYIFRFGRKIGGSSFDFFSLLNNSNIFNYKCEHEQCQEYLMHLGEPRVIKMLLRQNRKDKASARFFIPATPVETGNILNGKIKSESNRPTIKTVSIQELPKPKPSRDCQDIYDKNYKNMDPKSGNYLIYPNGLNPLDVYCEFVKENSATVGWTQVMNRSTVNSDRNLEIGKIPNYQRNGFGDVSSGDFWLGLEKIRFLTSFVGSMNVRFEMTMMNGSSFLNEYENFRMGGEAENYAFKFGRKVGGGPFDFFSLLNNTDMFSFKCESEKCREHTARVGMPKLIKMFLRKESKDKEILRFFNPTISLDKSNFKNEKKSQRAIYRRAVR